jgi:hypothetical protein
VTAEDATNLAPFAVFYLELGSLKLNYMYVINEICTVSIVRLFYEH